MSLLARAPLGVGMRASTALSRRAWRCPVAPGRMRLVARAAEPTEANSSRPVQKAVEEPAVEVKEPALAVNEPALAEQADQAGTAGAAATETSGAQEATKEQDPLIKPLSEQWVKEVVDELKDTSQLGNRGELWFLGQLALAALVVFAPVGLKGLIDVVGWLVVVTGFGLMVAGQQSLGENLTPLPKPRESNSLVTTGIYQQCRHPMYGGLVLAALGLTLATGSEVRLVMTIALFFLLDRKASYEEQLLGEKHPEYAEYQKKTMKLIPFLY